MKQPEEQYNLAVDWSAAVPTGGTLQSGTVTATDQAGGADASSVVLSSSTATIQGVRSQTTIRAGVSGHTYDLQYRVILTTGEVLEENIQMLVQSL